MIKKSVGVITQALLYTCSNSEWITLVVTSSKYTCSHVVMKQTENPDKFLGASYPEKYLPECVSVDHVKGFEKIYKGHVQRFVLFTTLLL